MNGAGNPGILQVRQAPGSGNYANFVDAISLPTIRFPVFL